MQNGQKAHWKRISFLLFYTTGDDTIYADASSFFLIKRKMPINSKNIEAIRCKYTSFLIHHFSVLNG